MNKFRILGTLWIILALYDLFYGLYFLFQYSTPGVFWFYMVPVWITASKVFLGMFGLTIGIAIFRRGEHSFILPFSALLLIFITTDFIKIGYDLVNDAGSNLIFFVLTVLTITLTNGFDPAKLKVLRKPKIFVFIAIGLIPYLLNGKMAYDWFSFLH